MRKLILGIIFSILGLIQCFGSVHITLSNYLTENRFEPGIVDKYTGTLNYYGLSCYVKIGLLLILTGFLLLIYGYFKEKTSYRYKNIVSGISFSFLGTIMYFGSIIFSIPKDISKIFKNYSFWGRMIFREIFPIYVIGIMLMLLGLLILLYVLFSKISEIPKVFATAYLSIYSLVLCLFPIHIVVAKTNRTFIIPTGEEGYTYPLFYTGMAYWMFIGMILFFISLIILIKTLLFTPNFLNK